MKNLVKLNIPDPEERDSLIRRLAACKSSEEAQRVIEAVQSLLDTKGDSDASDNSSDSES